MKQGWHDRPEGWMGQFRNSRSKRPRQPAGVTKCPVCHGDLAQAIRRPEVIWEPPPVCCPACKSENTVVTKTLLTAPVERYRLCRDCGCNFKTVQALRAD